MIVKPLCIAVSGGKGGTGKSTFARNLAVFFAQLGNRTALLDFSSSFASDFSFNSGFFASRFCSGFGSGFVLGWFGF